MSEEDPKKGEREYFARIGEEGRRHALRKPFGDPQCIQNLANAATIMALMRSPPARVAEFGCGSGWLSLLFAEQGYEVLGFDISPEAIALADSQKSKKELRNVQFRVADYEHIQASPLVDYIVFHDALHHAESPQAALQAAYRSLLPSGQVVCIEPGIGHANSPVSRYVVETYGVHEREMPPSTIINFANMAGFKRHVVLPWPWYYFAAVYRPGYSKGTSTADLKGKKLLSLWRFVRWFYRTREQGVVVLLK